MACLIFSLLGLTSLCFAFGVGKKAEDYFFFFSLQAERGTSPEGILVIAFATATLTRNDQSNWLSTAFLELKISAFLVNHEFLVLREQITKPK